MHRLIDSSASRSRRYSWWFSLGLIAVLFSLFTPIFSDNGLRVHAATVSSLKNMRESRNHHLNSHYLMSLSAEKSSRQIKSKPPALMLTRTSSPDMISHGKHAINYVLSVSNGRSAGPVAAGNTIVISNLIPEGVTDLIAHAKSSAWKVRLTSKIGPSILTATYVGAYPVLAGASLAPLLVHGILKHSKTHHLFLPAVVRLLHSDNPEKSSPKLLQQRPVQDFSVKGIAPQEVTPEGVTPLTNPTYQAGQTVAYTLAISNGNAVGSLITGDTITVTDSIPTGLTGLTASANSSDWSISLGATTSPTTLTATYIGTYPVLPGASFSPIILVGTLTSPAVPQVVNSAIVVTPNDSNAANNTGTNTINVIAAPDLTVTDPVPTGIYQVGKAITYTVTGSSLSSAGSVLAGDAITITDTIPIGLTGITASASSTNWSLSLSTMSGPATLTATYIGTYPVTAGTTLPAITISGTLTSTAVSSLLNTATISTPKDSNAANNTASNTITVVIQPDLTVTKTVPFGTTFQVGKFVTYTLTVSDAGGAGPVLTGDPITIVDTIPAGLTALTASGTNWTVSLSTTTSPSTLTATYTGTYPVAAGTSLSAISLTGKFTIASLSPSPITAGYWPFDANAGTTAYDSSPNHNNGTITGASWATGKVNSGLSFNGTSNYVSMGTHTALQFGTGSFTTMSWFKTASTSGVVRIISQGLGSLNGGFNISMNTTCAGCVSISLGGSGTTATTLLAGTGTAFSDGNWHQAAMIINRTANTAQLYIDGVAQSLTVSSGYCGTAAGTTVSIASCSSLTANTADPFVVGAYIGASGNSQYFNGSIDEVRAYNSALSSAQIQTLYTIDTPPTPTGYWPFDANIGTVAYDSSSNHNNGTLTGGPAWTTGAINSGLSFNGTSNYVTMGNLPTLQFGTGSFTAMAWFKTTSTSGFSRIINQGVGSFNGGFAIDINSPCSGCVSMVLGGNGSASTVMLAGTGISFADGNWHQAAMVINRTANTAQLYVDGVAQSLTSSNCGTAAGTTVNIASCTSLTANTTDPFVVGAYTGANGTFQYFTGSVDEVRVYGSALSSAQVYNLYTMPYTNTAAVTTPNDSNFTNNGAINKIQVIPQPDLSATKTVALSPTSLVREQAQRQPFRPALKAISRRRS